MARRVSFFLFSCILGLFIVGGCTKKVSAVKNAPKKELVMWLVGSESQAQGINELSKEWTQNTGVNVRCEAISWGDAHSKYLTSIAGGVAPDIGTMGLTWGAEFGILGAMVDLAKEFPEDIKLMKENTFKGLIDSVEYKDQVFGVPFDLSLQLVYLRTDLVSKAPYDWQELTQILEKLNKQGKGMLFDWGSIEWIGYAPFLWQAGGDFCKAGQAKADLNTDSAQVALKFFSELYTKYNVPKTAIPVEQGMRTGDYPIAISGNWKLVSLSLGAPELAGKWTISELPKGPTGKNTSFIGGRMAGIFSSSKNKKEAFEFIKFLFSPQVQAKLYQEAEKSQDAYLPSNKSAWNIITLKPEFKKIILRQLNDVKGPPAVLGWDEATRFVNEAIQRVILQGADIKKELDQACLNVDRIIK